MAHPETSPGIVDGVSTASLVWCPESPAFRRSTFLPRWWHCLPGHRTAIDVVLPQGVCILGQLHVLDEPFHHLLRRPVIHCHTETPSSYTLSHRHTVQVSQKHRPAAQCHTERYCPVIRCHRKRHCPMVNSRRDTVQWSVTERDTEVTRRGTV